MKTYTVKIDNDGTKHWYINGKLHREDGPAIEYADGHKEWYINDQLHRKDGPAIECADGTKAWYLNGKHVKQDVLNLSQTLEIEGVKYTIAQIKAALKKVA